MHLYANSMNVLSRLQSKDNRTGTSIGSGNQTAPPVIRRSASGLPRGAFELHRLSGGGSMTGEWNADTRLPSERSPWHQDVPVRVEEEIVVEEPSIFWG